MRLRTVAFYQLVGELSLYLGTGGLLLLVTAGFPWLAEFLGTRVASEPGLVRLAALGEVTRYLIPVVLLLLLSRSLVRAARREIRLSDQMQTEGVTYLLLPRRNGQPVRATQVQLWRRIAEILPPEQHVSFEVGGGRGGIVFSLRAPSATLAREVVSKVLEEWPHTQVEQAEGYVPLPMVEAVAWAEVCPQNREQPILLATPDPVGALLTQLAVLPDGVSGGMQVLVRADPYTDLRLSRKAARLTSKKPESGPYAYRPSAEEQRRVQELDQRARERFVEVRVLLWAAAADEAEARAWAQKLAYVLTGQFNQGTLLTGNRLQRGAEGMEALTARTFPLLTGMPWTTSELGALAYLPGRDGQIAAPQLRMAPALFLPASSQTEWCETSALPDMHDSEKQADASHKEHEEQVA